MVTPDQPGILLKGLTMTVGNRVSRGSPCRIVVVWTPEGLVTEGNLRIPAEAMSECQLDARLPIVIERIIKELPRAISVQSEPVLRRQFHPHARSEVERIPEDRDRLTVGFGDGDVQELILIVVLGC